MHEIHKLMYLLFFLFAGDVISAPLPVTAYGRMPAYADFSLSTGGSYMAAVLAVDGEYLLGIYELPLSAVSKTWYKRYDKGQINWIQWANDERLLVSVRFKDSARGVPISQTRLISLRYDGENPKNMVNLPKTEFAVLNQIRDNVVSMLPEDPDHILIGFSRNASNNYETEVRKVNVYSGKSTLVENSYEDIGDWMVDRNGVVRIGFGLHKQVNGRRDRTIKMILRDGQNGEWRDISDRFVVDGGKEFDDKVTFTPLGFDRDPNILYVLSNHESDTAAVYRYDIASDRFGEKLYGRDDVDISDLVYDSTGRDVVGVKYTTDVQEIHYLADDADAKVRADVSKMLNGAIVELVSATYDNSMQILSASGGENQLPRSYYQLDRTRGKIDKIGDAYPEISAEAIRPVEVTSYKARDELEIPAYVTLPPETQTLADAKLLPFVVLPHGGPYTREFKRFDFLAQFIASRGYGVLQMNFRGSSGYGTKFELAGSGEWGQAMQDDVTDGVNWLVDNGYADGKRICIAGWSYGAYSALVGSMKTPHLFQCTIGIAGVYDLNRAVRSSRRYIGGELSTRRIGKLWSDDEMLAKNSPVEHASEILKPVLLMHSADDRVVPVIQSQLMRDAMLKAGRPVTYFEFENGGHSLESRDRITMMSELESFLSAHLAKH